MRWSRLKIRFELKIVSDLFESSSHVSNTIQKKMGLNKKN